MAKADPSGEDISRAEKALDRHLQWVGRFDTRTSLIAGIAIAMLGVMATITPPLAKWTILLWVVVLISIACLGGCLLSLFFALFPKTGSPNASLLYFGTIADLKADEFRSGFHAQTAAEYFADLTDQCHVNACILKRKFLCLKIALALLLADAIPWAIVIFLSKHIGQ